MEENKEVEESKSTLKFKIANADKNTRAHVFAFTYLPNQPHEEFKNMVEITKSHLNTEVFPFTRWENAYQSNRKLGDEYRYVFNRKNAKRFIGNTLEKPQLILKRLKVRDTNFDTEVVKDGGEYGAFQAEKQFDLYRGPINTYNSLGGSLQFQNNIDKLCYLQNEIYGYQNFLKNATAVNQNLNETERGTFEWEFDASKYTNIMILATGEKSTTQVIYDLENPWEEIEKRNLALSDALDHTKFFNEVRNTDSVSKGETYRIRDITSSEYIFVDCLDKVKKASDDLCEIKGVSIDKDLMFLINWNTFSESEQNKKYSEFVCHEVNLFLYFKDHSYFVKVAKPFIASKMEKTFIDYWLLNEFESILHYQEIGNFDKLNTLEQSLLVFALSTINMDKAKSLARRIGDGSDAVSKESAGMKNRMFDTVLSLNLLQKDTTKLLVDSNQNLEVVATLLKKSREKCQTNIWPPPPNCGPPPQWFMSFNEKNS